MCGYASQGCEADDESRCDAEVTTLTRGGAVCQAVTKLTVAAKRGGFRATLYVAAGWQDAVTRDSFQPLAHPLACRKADAGDASGHM
jgi:hypothetical protein